MFQASAQALFKKAPQQAARIQTSTRTLSTDSISFYPVQRNRIRTAKQNSNLSFSYYPANVPQLKSASISDAKAVRATLVKKKASSSSYKKSWDSVAQTMKEVKKNNSTLLVKKSNAALP